MISHISKLLLKDSCFVISVAIKLSLLLYGMIYHTETKTAN